MAATAPLPLPQPAAPATSSSSYLPTTTSPYPYASAPDIIRAHQKDAYFSGTLTNQLVDLHRRLLGARSAHAWAAESRTLADLLYLGLTTLVGNRTLGEEYCDLVQVEAAHPALSRLPDVSRRAAYILGAVILPYVAGRALPSARGWIKGVLTRRLVSLAKRRKAEVSSEKTAPHRTVTATEREARVLKYVLAHLPTMTSGTHARAIILAAFYFTGAYYSLSKRVLGLRYVFTRRVPTGPGTERAGYEVLGVLLAAQLAAQAWLHIREIMQDGQQSGSSAENDMLLGTEEDLQQARLDRAATIRSTELSISLDENMYSSNNELLLPGDALSSSIEATKTLARLSALSHTPVITTGRGARFDLRDDKLMAWISGKQQRRCTLCLEELRDPSATQCGHVFCWTCICDWVREKPECPLCRREALVQHLLPLRAA